MSGKVGLKITEPFNGDILNRHDGLQEDSSLKIKVKGRAEEGMAVLVNGVEAEREGMYFQADISIDKLESTIVAQSRDGECRDEITVLWDKNSMKRYRFSVDDNILFLADIAKNVNKYNSIFDNPYMAMWREMYDKYDAKIHLNIYYQTEGFNLTYMPDKYKPEWQDNAHWLRLTFHALQNDPDRPYIRTSYEEIKGHCQMVTDEIIRFAGEELLSDFTTIHWGEVTREGCRAMRDFGFRGLVGYFAISGDRPYVSYYLDHDTACHAGARDYWKDMEEDIIFIKHDLVVNACALDEVVPKLEAIYKDSHQSEIIELLIHEQYFYPDYHAYQPDFKDKVEAAIKWVTEKSYVPVFYKDGFLGSPTSL